MRWLATSFVCAAACSGGGGSDSQLPQAGGSGAAGAPNIAGNAAVAEAGSSAAAADRGGASGASAAAAGTSAAGRGGDATGAGGATGGAGGAGAVGGTAGRGDGGGRAGTGTSGDSAGLGGRGGRESAGTGNGGGAGTASAGTAGRGSAGSGSDRCDVAVYDPAHPPQVLALTGNLGTHDPALIEVNGKYYLYATGDGLGAKTSTNLTAWSAAPAVFGSNPAWIADEVPGATNLWAPDIAEFGGQYHLYYAASTFGSNHSCIGHATRAALDTGSFADHGSVLCSNAGSASDDFNAIDPNVVLDEAGTPWLSFGSFWSGIKLVKLAPDGTRADTQLKGIANRPQNGGALEGPFIVRRCGYYYLFVSFGACCGSPWDYDVRVGRSASVQGPYVDKAGTNLTQGGGTLLVTGSATWTAPGHNAVIFTATGAYNVYHALDANHQNPVLRVAELVWDADGWPISGGP
jgi:arabinan endo-1,5-alpha-L-arabinosidase